MTVCSASPEVLDCSALWVPSQTLKPPQGTLNKQKGKLALYVALLLGLFANVLLVSALFALAVRTVGRALLGTLRGTLSVRVGKPGCYSS